MPRKDARSPDGPGANDAGAGGAPDDLDAAVAELYGGPLDSFVPRRDALARTLRSESRRDDASTVASLRKPKRLAWALDAARLTNPTAVDDLAGAAEAVADAQATGGDLRAATARLREVQDALVDVALDAARAADQRVDRSEVGLAVRAVASDPEALSDLRSGRLIDVPTTGGLGGLDLAFGAEARAAPRGGPRGRAGAMAEARDRAAPPKRTVDAARRALERAETKADAADRRAREAAERAGVAGEEAREAERELAAATERAEAARRAAEDAQRESDTAAEERDEAAAALADARELVAELER
ncbi:MAG TPA: hypothetical protein VFZ68_17710 [Acidimicrobiales bacterium]